MNTNQLPDSLVAQLRSYEARLRRMETIAAFAGGLAGLLITYVLLFVADRFINTPIAARMTLTVCGAVLAAWFAQSWARYWLWNRRGPAQLAKLLQKKFRTLGDRLQGVIELTETDELPENISPALLRAAVRQVAEESGRFNFEQAVPTKPARRWAFAALLVTALTAAPFVFVPRAATNAVQRWAMPWADIERYTFTTVEQLPGELFVAHGEEFPLVVGLRADAEWKPGSATAQIAQQPKIVAEVLEGKALFKFPGQTRVGTLSLRFGDYLKDIDVHPLHRPELKELAARVQLPDYLGYPETRVKVHGSASDFLAGSKVAFEGKISRSVGSGEMRIGETTHAAKTEGDIFTTPVTPLEEFDKEVTLRWTDIYGLTPVQPYAVRIGTTKDAEPRIELQGLQEQEIAILPHENVRFTLAGGDDYGLKEIWVAWTTRRIGEKTKAEVKKSDDKDWVGKLWEDWKTQTAAKKEQPPGPIEMPRIAGAQTMKEIVKPITWTPAELGVAQDTIIELTGYALDYLPERVPSQTHKLTIYVLSPEKHAERVRERMDQVLKQLDDRIRDEERALEENKAITDNKKELNSERTAEDIKKVEAGEKANEEALQKLNEQIADIMKDALRNKDIQHDTLSELSKIAETLQQKAQPEMQNAQQQMAKAGQSQQQREQDLKKAQEHQENALAAMRDAASKMQTANENLFARNFYNRLRHAASSEMQISDGLKKLAKKTIGLKTDEIGEGEKKEFDGVAGKQDGAVKDVDGIQTDMTGFLRRVPNEKYQAVVSEMEETRVVGELGELAGFVRANLAMKSVGRAKTWGDQLNKWAEMIQSECKSDGKGGEQEMDPDMMELMIGMVRAAVAQDSIREQTGDLEKQKDTNATYAGDADKLGGVQGRLGGAIKEMRENPKFGKFMGEVGPLLDKVEELMRETGGALRKPDTGQETVTTQGVIIELLVPPDKKGGKPSESKSMAQMQKQMQQMMQQMSKSRTAGRNASRNASNLAGTNAEGPGGGKKANTRLVDKTGGAANAGEWPEEFRDALQSYIQSIEEQKK